MNPRRSTGLATLLAALLVAAGCTAPTAPGAEPGPSPPDSGAPEAPPPGPVQVALNDCTLVEALTALPLAAVRPHVPPDFEPVATPAGVPAAFGGTVCAPVPGAEAPEAFGLLAVLVTPLHDSLKNESVGRYFWKMAWEVPPSALSVELAGQHANVTPVSEVALEATPSGHRFRVTTAPWTHRVTVDPAPGAPGSGRALDNEPVFREYSAAEGGYVYLDARFAPRDGTTVWGGPATVEPGDGTLARELLGERATLPAVVYVRVDYQGAALGFVPTPP